MRRFRPSWIVVGIGALLTAMLSYSASGSETINYTYDAKGRLILAEHSGSVNNNVVVNYTLDSADNRKNIKVTGAP